MAFVSVPDQAEFEALQQAVSDLEARVAALEAQDVSGELAELDSRLDAIAGGAADPTPE